METTTTTNPSWWQRLRGWLRGEEDPVGDPQRRAQRRSPIGFTADNDGTRRHRRSLTLQQAAQRFGCSDVHLGRLARAGKIPATDASRPGAKRRSFRVSGPELEEHFRAHPELLRRTGPRGPYSAPYRGVSRTDSGRYRAYIHKGGEYVHLGVYDTPEEAARAYDRAALLHFGERARTNTTTHYPKGV